MTEPHDPNRTVDVPSAPADSIDAGLAAGFGRPADGPDSALNELRSSLGPLRPVLLPDAEGESAHIVQPKSDAMPSPQETGDRYQLSGEIARGGMGAVLRGRDTDLGRDLAVKVLLEKYADRPEVARRFIEEAQIGGQLQHPGVVPVYDIGRFGDRPFFTMKLVKGQTLAALLAERTNGANPEIARRASKGSDPCLRVGLSGAPPDLPRFLDIALKVSQTLAYAHAKGVIHRDLKPANIMVGAFGEVQVMDWGLAKVLAEGGIADEERASRGRKSPEDVTHIRTARSSGSAGSGTDTEAGSLLGTPAYMPPEQANGDVALLDRRADVFGLGALLCEILTGKPPYVGRSSEEVRRKAANGDLADTLARLDGCGTDTELIALTKACLAPEAIDRPKDAQSVAEGLTAYLDSVQERLHQAELAEAEAKAKAVEEAKRRRLTLALAATVLLAVALGGGGGLWVKADRDTRLAQVTRDVHEALNQATALRERAKADALGGAALSAQARERAQRARALAESGPVDAALAAQVRQLQAELDEEEKDRELVLALDEARLDQAVTVAGENRFADERAVPRFREAFRAYGLPAGEGEPATVAQRIGQRPAAVQAAIFAALDEWDELADNARLGIIEAHRDWLRALLAAAEPDGAWTRQVRTARVEKDPARRLAALAKLAASADVEKIPRQALIQLALRLDPTTQVVLLRRAQARYPADFWVNEELGLGLQNVEPPKWDEAVRFLTAAVALRPTSPGCLLNLGSALAGKGQVDEAIACYKKAIQLAPKYAVAHNNLGLARSKKGQVDAAIACYRQAIQLDRKLAGVHYNLAAELYRTDQVDEAIACFKKAIEVDPKDTKAYVHLGIALADKGQVDEAIAYYKKAIQLDPRNVEAHNNLGAVLCDKKHDYDGAIASFQKAIAVDPKNATAHANLGNALSREGQLDRAIACFQKAIQLDPLDAPVHSTLAWVYQRKGDLDRAILEYQEALRLNPKEPDAVANLPRAVRMRHLIALLADVLAGRVEPKTPADTVELASLCLQPFQKRYGDAVRLYEKAFAADPKLAADRDNSARYDAACAAALTAAGQSTGVQPLDDSAKAKLRRQALDWLKGELTAWTQLLESGPRQARTKIATTLRHWQQDSDLASVRDAKALAALTAHERDGWCQLWADVAALLKKAEPLAKKESER